MTNEEIEILDRRQAHPDSDHAVESALGVNDFAGGSQP
jgi:hypothetical protein